MKKAILALALFAGVYTVADAQHKAQKQGKEQRNMSAEQRAEQHASRLQKSLNLTDAQRQAIYEADMASAKEMQPLKDDQKMTREKIVSLQKQREEKMKSILTADQFKKLEQMKADRRTKMLQHRAERKAQGQHMQGAQAKPAEVK